MIPTLATSPPLPTPDQLEDYNMRDSVSPYFLGKRASDGGDDSDVSTLLYHLQREHVCFHRERVESYVTTSPGLVVELSNGEIDMLFVFVRKLCKSCKMHSRMMLAIDPMHSFYNYSCL